MKYIVSLSGGKESTAMLLWLDKRKFPIDEIIFFDGGWEFPGIIRHIKKLQQRFPITILKPDYPFTYYLKEHPVSSRKTGEIHRIGYGWPSYFRRWCTRKKIDTINNYLRKNYSEYKTYLGININEIHRKDKLLNVSSNYLFPLIDWNKTDKDCLIYSYKEGYTFGYLYNIFNRVSCYCCPLQRMTNLKKLYKYYPNLWKKMLDMEDLSNPTFRGFKNYKSLHDLDKEFSNKEE